MKITSKLIRKTLKEAALPQMHASRLLIGAARLPCALFYLSTSSLDHGAAEQRLAGCVLVDAVGLQGVGKRTEFSCTLGLSVSAQGVGSPSVVGFRSRAPGDNAWKSVPDLQFRLTGVSNHRGAAALIARGIEEWAVSPEAKPVLVAALSESLRSLARPSRGYERMAELYENDARVLGYGPNVVASAGKHWRDLAEQRPVVEAFLRNLHAAWAGTP
jgi:hypothetical protein